MTTLFNNSKLPNNSDYSAKDIEVLEGLEPVRRRPGMYIGGNDETALHHLAVEVLDNAMDEAVAGHATHIDVELSVQGYLTIRDNGRGIPIDEHPKFPGKSALEVILTTLHSGGKFNGKAYKTSGGLHGVGLSVVNALADDLIVEVINQKKIWRQSYKRGHPVGNITTVGNAASRRGTSISFHPDADIFEKGARFRAAKLYKMIRSKAFLFRGVEIRWQCAPELLKGDETTPQSETLHFPGGLVDFLTESTNTVDLVIPLLFQGEANFTDDEGRMEWAIAWPLYDDGFCSSFCNTIATPLGGTHENGFRQGLTKSLRTYGERVGNKKANLITADDCAGGSMILLSVFMRDPQFQGQTKEKLLSNQTTRWVEAIIKDHFDHWLVANKAEAEILLNYVVDQADERLKRKQIKETARQSPTKRLRLPGKLADCTSGDPVETEIFLVEGDSAGGSAKQARNRKTQAVLPLRGKILNVASATVDKMINNQELTDLGKALGCALGKTCDTSQLRYGRVIIMTDADVDGAHIASLLLTFFFQQMKPLLVEGCIYLAMPPLYRLVQGNKAIYARDDNHKNKLMKKEFTGRGKVEISRFKGLGEMPWQQLKETTMDPEKRMLQKVILPDHLVHFTESADASLAINIEEFVDQLMGRRAEKRFEFIQANANTVTNLDI